MHLRSLLLVSATAIVASCQQGAPAASDPLNAEAYFERGFAYAIEGEFELAIADLSNSIEIDPDYIPAYQLRAHAYHNAGRFRQAVADYDAVISIDPDMADNHYWRGRANARIGETASAISDLEQALELGLGQEHRENAETLLNDLQSLMAGQANFDGYWGGNTGQGEIIEFTIEEGGVLSLRYGFRIPGCGSLSTFSFGGIPVPGAEASTFVEGNTFSISKNFYSISGTFTSSNFAIGTLDINCEDGLSTSWNAARGVRAVRTPTPEDLAKIPDFDVDDRHFSPADGSSNFDEVTWILTEKDDWYLLRNFSESVVPIPRGWTSISTASGAHYQFRSEVESKDPSIDVTVDRDCSEAETAEQYLLEFEEAVNSESTVEILKTEVLDAQKGFQFLSVGSEPGSRFYAVLIASKPADGCFFFLTSRASHEDWPEYYPLIRVIALHWFDLKGNLLGFALPEALMD